MASVTPEQVAADYLVGLLPATRRSYRATLQSWWEWCAAHHLHPLTDVRRVHIEMWGRYQHEILGLELATVASRFTPVCGYYDYAHAEGYIAADPAARVRRPRIKRGSAGSFLTRAQLVDMLAASLTHEQPTVGALVHLLGLSGLRLGETLAIDIGHLAWHAGHRTVVLDRKGHHRQILSLPDATSAAVDKAIADRTTGPVLRNLDGGRLAAATARALIAHLGRQVGADRTITPHSLRRTFVTLALDAGISDRDIMATTGHSSPEMIWHYDTSRASVERNAGHQLADWLTAP